MLREYAEPTMKSPRKTSLPAPTVATVAFYLGFVLVAACSASVEESDSCTDCESKAKVPSPLHSDELLAQRTGPLEPSIWKEKIFRHPRVGGILLDYCREVSSNCGWLAAHAYCKAKNYDLAIDFTVSRAYRTRVIYGGQVCESKNGSCTRISWLECRKRTSETPG